MTGRAAAVLRAHDPDHYALHKALRAAITTPLLFAFGLEVLQRPQLATFAAFGAFALLVFVDFPGSRTGRLGAYLMLALVGSVMITLGTLASGMRWVAVVAMGLAGFATLFAGVLSAACASAGRSVLLTFILPVTIPGTAADVLPRVAGWLLASLVCIPAAMMLWPPRQHDRLRAATAVACRAFASLLAQPGPDPLAEAHDAMVALRASFRSSPFRPVGLTTGSRTLVRLIDELEWLLSLAGAACTGDASRWHAAPSPLRAATVAVLDANARVLSNERSEPDPRAIDDLGHRLAELESCLATVAAASVRALSDGGPEQAGREFAVHELAYAVLLAGQAVALMAAADARPLLERLSGRRVHGLVEGMGAAPDLGPVRAAVQIAGGHADPHSIWLQNSLRGGLGLALAVLLVELTDVQHGFWVGLGAMSVLRTTALSTGATVLRALLGTVLGFVVGGLLIVVIGTQPAVLWCVLPVAVLVAGFAPEAVSFVAGQAAFTVTVIVLFNLLDPTGWEVGLVRIEDVAIGSAASLLVGVLLWPRGAAAGLGRALRDGFEAGAAYLDRALGFALADGPSPADEHVKALAAARRLDDAFRQYLAETGPKRVDIASVTAAANGSSRVRLAADALAGLRGDGGSAGPPALDGPQDALVRRGDAVVGWFSELAESFDGSSGPAPRAPDVRPTVDEELVSALRRAVHSQAGSGARDRAGRLLWAAQYLHDLERLEPKLVGPATELQAAASRSWWH